MSERPHSHPRGERPRGPTTALRIHVALLVALAAALLSALPAAAAAPLYYGAIVEGRAPTAEAIAPGGAFHTFEDQAGKRMSLVQWGQPWRMNGEMQPFQRAYFDNVRAHGALPVLNWASQELGKGIAQEAFQLRHVAAGAYDGYIAEWARDARAWGHPFMLRFNHEM